MYENDDYATVKHIDMKVQTLIHIYSLHPLHKQA